MFAHGTPLGVGGLGHHAAHVLGALAPLIPALRLYGPRPLGQVNAPDDARVTPPASLVPAWRRRYTWLRYLTGRYQHAVDRQFGRWLASELETLSFDQGYFFTQLARESLALARGRGAATILDNPNGHIRDFREQLCRESRRWTGWPYLGHPSEAMVTRVEEEYRLADSIRVSSRWAKASLVRYGVEEGKVFVVPQAIDVNRFVPPAPRTAATGPLRLVFVGSVSLGKGFQYLLRAMSRVGGHHVSLEIVGATGDPWNHRLLNRLKAGLQVVHASGDPIPAYQRGELFVLPSLHDGFGLVVPEAMACGLPVVTTDGCGASEWVSGESGWVLPRGDEAALVATLESALAHRDRLPDMGRAARRTAERLSEDVVRPGLQRCVAERWRLQ